MPDSGFLPLERPKSRHPRQQKGQQAEGVAWGDRYLLVFLVDLERYFLGRHKRRKTPRVCGS